jgi:serine/threonine protein kinase
MKPSLHTVVHPSFLHLLPFIESIPERFGVLGEVIYKARNEIRLIHAGGVDMVVKSFRVPHLINRIAYASIRQSKAIRSYLNAIRLEEEGVCTPSPIAYIEERNGCLLGRSYYISVYIPGCNTLRDLHDCDLGSVREIAEAFAHFTASLHAARILHRDYSPGNILYRKDGEADGSADGLAYTFCLVDINRMSFDRYIDLQTAAFTLRKLWGDVEVARYVARIYAADRSFDAARLDKRLLRHRLRFWRHP